MKRTIINLNLSATSIDNAIKTLDAFKKDLREKEDKLMKALGEIGVKEASVRFTTAMYDGTNDVSVKLDTTKNGYAIIAEGKAVAFIEFGAGVYHNTGEPYPNPRPTGIVGIGEYGKGYGKRNAWGYRDENDELVITRGNPAAMPMWYASEEMKNSITKIVREVWG